VQPLQAAPSDVHLAEKQISKNAEEGQNANHYHPGNAGSRVPMRAQENPNNYDKLEQGDEGDNDQRVLELWNHAWTS
jgi:hypothetical protein